MDRNSVDWKGYWPACPTPFKTNGEIDFESFDKLLDWYLDRKMQGLFINGTTGEWFAQSHQERKEIAKFVADKVAGQIPIVIGITTFTAKESIELGEHAMSVGISGVCSSAPAYAKTLPHETSTRSELNQERLPSGCWGCPRSRRCGSGRRVRW